MPIVTIDDREIEVPAGTNLIEAALQVGVQIPHYCYHPRLTVVGQCRMCLVKVEGMPKLQAGCTTQVMKDGMVVSTTAPEVSEAQRSIMELLLINHPLDCPICDQAGECGLQDYAFKHGVAFSRFNFEDKRVYLGRERIPLGPSVVLNMNRCIQCTRCVRFTREVSQTGEIGFFQRGARAEIGVFPGKPLDNHLSGNVVDICPVGALTSRQFRFAERVWYLDKRPSLCTGCDVGCNITIEHRRGAIKRYKPRHNEAVNDYWLCDYGRESHRRYSAVPRLTAPRLRRDGVPTAVTWSEALDVLHQRLRARAGDGEHAFLASGHLTTEEAWLLAKLADLAGTPHRAIWAPPSPPWHIPNPQGGVTAVDAAPNRRGAELAGLTSREGGLAASDLVEGDAASRLSVLLVGDGDLGEAAHDPAVVERLRRAGFLVVLGWGETPLAEAADLALPLATHAEKAGSFVNVQGRLQRFRQAFPAPGEARPGVDILLEVLQRWDAASWGEVTPATVFDRMAEELPRLAGMTLEGVPPVGVALEGVAAESA